MTIDQGHEPVLGVAEVEPDDAPRPVRRRRWGFGLDRFSGLYAWALIIAIFAIWVPETFLTSTTLKLILGDQAFTGMLALALVVPLAAGTIDLSVAAAMGTCMVIVTVLQVNHGMGTVPAIVLTLIAALGIGLVNGFVVVNLRISSFIATLATGSLLDALAIWLSDNGQVQGLSKDFLNLGQGEIAGIPLPFIYLIGLSAVVWYVLEYTPLGRYFYAMGGNPEATRLAGMRNGLYTRLALITSSLIAGVAGIVLAANIGVASASIAPPYLLPAFAAVFLGSTQIKKGRANVLGTLIATYLLATGIKGLQLVSAGPWVSGAFNGIALIVAVGLAVARGRGSIERVA